MNQRVFAAMIAVFAVVVGIVVLRPADGPIPDAMPADAFSKGTPTQRVLDPDSDFAGSERAIAHSAQTKVSESDTSKEQAARIDQFPALEAELVARGLDARERLMVMASTFGQCTSQSIQDRFPPEGEEAIKAFREHKEVLTAFRNRYCSGIPDGYEESINAQWASLKDNDPLKDEASLLGKILLETPNEPLALEKLEGLATSAASSQVRETATQWLIRTKPRDSSLGKMSAHVTQDPERLRKLQFASLFLSKCAHLAQCGPGQIQYVSACSDVSQCRHGESLTQFYRRTFSPDEYQAIEKMAALLAEQFGGG